MHYCFEYISLLVSHSPGESKAKHVILLEVNESKWRSINLPLSSVRPFVWDNIVLAAQQPPLDPTDTAAITALLERKVGEMLHTLEVVGNIVSYTD